MLGGARQTGKSTLATDLLRPPADGRFSFDDQATLQRAIDDPVGFVSSLPRSTLVDEFQRAGQGFLLAVKQAVDADRTRGQFLLTGSANYIADRSISETLAGRAGRLVLWPLSQGELRGMRETFLDHLFDPAAWPPPSGTEPLTRAAIVDAIVTGGYPEVVTEGLQHRQRRSWFEAYVADVVSREALRPLFDLRLETELRRVLRLLAARTGQELVISALATDAGLNRETTANYVSLLEALYLIVVIPAWSTSATTRAKRRPKVVVTDSGLAADLIGAGEAAFGPASDGKVAGALFETFVVTELHKHAGWAERTIDLAHFRDRNGAEVDLIVEDRRSGRLSGIEVKLSATPTVRDARHLTLLRERLGDRFAVGVVVHAGTQTLSLGERLWAVPVTTLWRSDPASA